MHARALLVSDYMTRNPVTLSPEDSLLQAAETMRLKGVRRIPITVGGMLMGLATEGDLKRAEPSTLTGSVEEFNKVMEETPISRIMIQNPITVTAETPLLEAVDTLYNTKYGALPVVTGSHVEGILTDNDLVHALLDVLRGNEPDRQD
jgi:acetoin utilization protein AcuB